MKLLNLLILLLIITLLATAVLPRLMPAPLRPDLYIILLIFLGVRARRDQILPLAWLTGLVRDIACGGPLGGMALLYLLGGVILLRGRRLFNARHPAYPAVAAFVAAFATEAILLMPAAMKTEWGLAADALLVLAMSSAVTGGLAPICVWLLDRMRGWLGLERWFAFGH